MVKMKPFFGSFGPQCRIPSITGVMPGAAIDSSGDLNLRVWKCGEVGYLRKTGSLWLGCPNPYTLSPQP